MGASFEGAADLTPVHFHLTSRYEIELSFSIRLCCILGVCSVMHQGSLLYVAFWESALCCRVLGYQRGPSSVQVDPGPIRRPHPSSCSSSTGALRKRSPRAASRSGQMPASSTSACEGVTLHSTTFLVAKIIEAKLQNQIENSKLLNIMAAAGSVSAAMGGGRGIGQE